MTLRKAGLPETVSKVCLGDAFVYGFSKIIPSYASNADAIWLFLAAFMLTFLRADYEC